MAEVGVDLVFPAVESGIPDISSVQVSQELMEVISAFETPALSSLVLDWRDLSRMDTSEDDQENALLFSSVPFKVRAAVGDHLDRFRIDSDAVTDAALVRQA
ncbi:hypothetical protein DFQ27_005885, partial [Actinomortierella ambigua]